MDFSWLSQFFETILSLVPHLKIIKSTHAGVKFRHGKTVKQVGPGLCWYWPLVTELDVWPVVRQTNNLANQSAVTKDKIAVCISAIVVFRISDIVLAMARSWEVDQTINDITMTAIVPVIMKSTYDELITKISSEQIQQELTKAVRPKLKKYGVHVVSVGLTDFTKASAINLLNNNFTTTK